MQFPDGCKNVCIGVGIEVCIGVGIDLHELSVLHAV